MKSQVSFIFDGDHNKQFILKMLKTNLRGIKTSIETIGFNTFRVFVASTIETKESIFNVCYGRCSNVEYDTSKEI